MNLLVSILIALSLVSITPFLSRKTKIPSVVLEMLLGMIFGKSFLNLVNVSSEVIDFFVYFGLVYLMFLSGIEVNFLMIKRKIRKILPVSSFSLTFPIMFSVLCLFELPKNELLFISIALSTTSLGVVFPLSKELKIEKSYSEILVASAALVDILSIYLLSTTVSIISGEKILSIIYSVIFVSFLFFLPYILKKKEIELIEKWICYSHLEEWVRISFALIVLFVSLISITKVHSILGAFISGLIFSELIPHERTWLKQKMEAFGYGFFIPLFFFFVGAKTDIRVLLFSANSILLFLIIVFIAFFSKILGVAISFKKFVGLKWKNSIGMGLFHVPRLSLIIAAAEIGISQGIISDTFYSILIGVSILSVLIAPFFGRILLRK